MSETPADTAALPEVAYYYPEPYWGMREVDDLKSVLLFFDQIAILLPSYMAGREEEADPVLAAPLKERGLLHILQPENFVDREMTEALTTALGALIDRGVFDDLEVSQHDPRYRALSRSRLGWNADIHLASAVIEELQRRGLAQPSQDSLSVPLHPQVRTTTLVLLSQLARAAGQRRGLDLHPITTRPDALTQLLTTLSLPHMPSQGHIVTLDLKTVALDLEQQPLDEILDFRRQHGPEYRAYARDLRKLIALLSPLPPAERDQLLVDRRDELDERAHDLRQTALKAWRRPLASLAVGAAGATWFVHQGDAMSAFVSLATGILGAAVAKPEGGAYSYLLTAERELSRPAHRRPLVPGLGPLPDVDF